MWSVYIAVIDNMSTLVFAILLILVTMVTTTPQTLDEQRVYTDEELEQYARLFEEQRKQRGHQQVNTHGRRSVSAICSIVSL